MNPKIPGWVRIGAVAWTMLAAGGGAWWRVEARRADAARARVAGLVAERDRLAAAEPRDPAEDERTRADAVATAERRLAALRAAFAQDPLDDRNPSGLDLLFDAAGSLERLRGRAAAAGVALAADESLGLASYLRAGAVETDRPAAAEQLRTLAFLAEILIEARPRAIHGVQRERQGSSAAAPADPLPPASPPPLRAPGVLAATAFRLEFTGRTATLRALLGHVSTGRRPLVVRRVAVTPADREGPAAAGFAPGLVVPSGWSRFVVVVEHLVLENP